MALSLVLDAFKKAQRGPQPQGGPRSSALAPTGRGIARGSLGVYGSRPFKGRDTMAGERKELALMRSPVFQQYVRSLGKRMA